MSQTLFGHFFETVYFSFQIYFKRCKCIHVLQLWANFVEIFLWESGFSNFGHVTISRSENLFFGRHFETVLFFGVLFFCCWNLVVISVCIHGVKIILKFWWKSGFPKGGSMDPPYALTEVGVPYAVKCYCKVK